MRAFALASCALLYFACGGGSRNAAPGARADRGAMTAIDEAVALLLEMGEVVMSAEDDCDLMATKVGSWIDANGERRKRVDAELLRIESPATQDAYRQRLSRHLDVVYAMKAGIEGCEGNASFVRAWNRLDE